jgi:acetylornithine/N-succinyldiaminopimelate aminotransferase
LAVLEVIEKDNLIQKARESGEYLMKNLKEIPGLLNLRGMGLMIGFDLPDNKKDLRTRLLSEFGIFTGEAKPNTVRLLPMLNISKMEMDEMLNALRVLA